MAPRMHELPTGAEIREDPMTVDTSELQEQLQRFTTRFIDRVTQATETLERSSSARVRDSALRKNLLYVSSALEIATGPVSEINLLDMFVFVRLCRAALDKHLVPALYGAQGADLVEAFARSDEELAEIATRGIDDARRAELASLVERWLAENPDQTRVEGVRLADFAGAAGAAAAGRILQVSGLLSSVKGATRAANEAMLLVERGLFLFHRLPFLWRLQARLAAREMLGDSVVQLVEGPRAPIARMKAGARRLARSAVAYAGVLGGVMLFIAWRRSA